MGLMKNKSIIDFTRQLNLILERIDKILKTLDFHFLKNNSHHNVKL